mmetsp:Transcript_11330/g.26065  ORF Transcript_11330/g.26065 Transcript_11330/m.26065 type:complete len:223 (+) Transcript_11330:71-739(+)
MKPVLPWFYLDDYGQEQGPLPSTKLREMSTSGAVSPALLVRLPNWDRHFAVEELWSNSEVAFLLPPAWPDIYTSAKGDKWGTASQQESVAISLEPALLSTQGVQSPSSGRAEGSQASSVGSAKADVEREIAQLLAATPWLRRSDFDPQVRQHLHAFHGLGGALQVRAALEEVRSTTEGRNRASVRSWPAYLYKLLKNAFVDAKAARNEPSSGWRSGGASSSA